MASLMIISASLVALGFAVYQRIFVATERYVVIARLESA